MNSNLSQTPYFIRALWEWCSDAGLSPQIVVHVDEYVRVPRGFVVDDRIVLDIGSEATNQLELGDEWITFQARFGTKVENIEIPVGNIIAIFAEETNQGMGFELNLLSDNEATSEGHNDDLPPPSRSEVSEDQTEGQPAEPSKGSPLKIVK